MQVGEYREDLVARVRVLSGALTTLLVVIGACFWVVQIVQGAYYRDLAENNRLRKLPIQAPRGLVYDRDGEILVENVASYNLMLDRSRSPDLAASLAFAAAILERPAADLAALLERYRATPRFALVLIAENLSLGQVARFGVHNLEHPEFEVEVAPLRLYRHAEQTSHVLGYLGEVTAEELQSRPGVYTAGDWVGKKGIEQRYDDGLRGRDGERVAVVDSRGRLLEEYRGLQAVGGRSLTLTLDLELQQAAERLLRDKVGAVVALDPRNGDVLAMASSPAYNPNLFARRLQPQEWQALLAAPNQPLQNRAVQNTYSPGSLFKIVIALAGLTEKVIDPRDTVYCGGSASFYNHRFRCWRQGGHGRVDFTAALRGSCNVYFYTVGQRLGIERIARYARLLGLGDPSGLDLNGEKSGNVPDPRWSERVRRTPWYPGETISVAIGQGPLLVTPLQIANLMAVVANGGYKVQPHLVRGAVPPERHRLPIDAAALEVVRRGLQAVVESGTGGNARVPGLDIAGKTGTVQVVAQKTWTRSEDLPPEHRDQAWFASFAPVAEPRLVVVVFIEHGGMGSQAAAPIAKQLYETYFRADLRDHQPI
jgi:penicillin-binding protein 2